TADIPNAQDVQVTVPPGANVNLKTESGDINFDGTFPTTGTSQFQTTNGDITITVPSNSAFHLDASTNSGSINSDFPTVNGQDNASGSGQSVNTMVGANTHSQVPNVVITSDSGTISLNSK
ncbi:MAG TPA: DUF4097 family beta strand repeat-containing protein, partial [Ktedonobacteraceae bacterium]|nr:DUF4097 family beta strand repeat-containing protein [Ktedonobacteraceae bacterium]